MNDVLRCLGRLAATGWRTDRRRLVVGGALVLAGALCTPLVAVAVRRLVDELLAGRTVSAAWAAMGVALLLTGELMLGHFAHLSYFELAEAVEERFNRDLAHLVNGVGDVDRHDDPGFADRVHLLRQDVLQMRGATQAGFQLVASAAQMVATAVVVATVSPLLLLLVPLAALPVVLGERAEVGLQAAREDQAATTRAVSALRTLATRPTAQKEVRLSGAADFVVARQRDLLGSYGVAMARADRRYALLRAAGQLAFGLGYAAAVLAVFHLAREGRATAGDVVLTVTLATQLSVQMAAGVATLGTVHRASAGLRRLEHLATDVVALPGGTCDAPARAGGGIRLEGVTYSYPGSHRPALVDVDLHLPAGTSVALVGENGAGKSTLLTLLGGLRRPTSGRLLVDGVDLATVAPGRWQERTATLFQDFARVELTLQHSVGIGWLPDVDDPAAITAALARTGAPLTGDVAPGDLVGLGYGPGRDLSGGQWQTVGLARTLMRRDPLLLVLDEPGAALDAEAEQRLVDAYQGTAREVAARAGGVTIFVTHRLSTVRLADHVVVLCEGRVVEQGTHDELVARGGRYAELWSMQARAYGPGDAPTGSRGP